MEELRATLAKEAEEFLEKTMEVGKTVKVEGLDKLHVSIATANVVDRMSKSFGYVLSTSDEQLEEGAVELRKYINLFSIEDEYAILKTKKSTPLYALMQVLVDCENDGLFKNEEMFEYAMQQSAESIHYSLVELGCEDPVLEENEVDSNEEESNIRKSFEELLAMAEDMSRHSEEDEWEL